jgi:hypothetical protein
MKIFLTNHKITVGGKKVLQKEKWGNDIEFLMSCIALSGEL